MLARFALAIALTAATASVAPAAPDAGITHVGVMADVGAPDGAVASIVVRPVRALRLHAGIGHNGVSTGARAGLTLVPLPTWLSPTLSIDYGRYVEGDANPLARTLSGDPTYSSSLLERVGYDYANGHIGLELGHWRATFYLHAGMSRITSELHGLDTIASTDEMSASVGRSRLTMWSVSGRVGLVIYLL